MKTFECRYVDTSVNPVSELEDQYALAQDSIRRMYTDGWKLVATHSWKKWYCEAYAWSMLRLYFVREVDENILGVVGGVRNEDF